jgi:hypothetical protein
MPVCRLARRLTPWTVGWMDGLLTPANMVMRRALFTRSLPARLLRPTPALANTGAKTNNKTSGGTQHAQPLQTLVSGPGIRKVHLAVVP